MLSSCTSGCTSLPFSRQTLRQCRRKQIGRPASRQQRTGWDSLQADTAAYYGRMKKSRDLSRLAVESAQRNGSNDNAALWMVNAALREAEFGGRNQARQNAENALALVDSKDIQTIAALALARAGDVVQAQALAERISKDYPSNTVLNYYWLPT